MKTNDPTIEFFKRKIGEFSQLELCRFLKCITGFVSIPYGGFQKKLKIIPSHRNYAHTCITVFTLEMKRYTDYKQFEEDFMLFVYSDSSPMDEL